MARVLLVEDDPDQLEVRKLILEAAGHQVAAAVTAQAAIASCRESEIIVLDLVPGSADLLAAAPPETRIIVLSGHEVQPGSLRADCILQKPCPTRALLAAIAAI